jgi:hypothetical protein
MHGITDMTNPWFYGEKFRCEVCSKILSDPLIGTQGIVCCRKCTKEATKRFQLTVTQSMQWYKCQLLDDLLMLSHIRIDMNLFRIVEDNQFTCIDDDEAMQVLEMIDTENTNRIRTIAIKTKNNPPNYNPMITENESMNDIEIFVKIFSNSTLIRQIARVLSDMYTKTKKMWRGIDGWNLIHYVCRFGNLGLIRGIINEFKFDLNDHCDQIKLYPMHIISSKSNVLKSSKEQFDAVQFFMEMNVDMNVQNNDGLSPVHLLSSLENNLDPLDQCEAINTMIRYKVDFNMQNKNGSTPLHHFFNGRTKISAQQRLEIVLKIIGYNISDQMVNLISDPLNNKFSSSDQYIMFNALINVWANDGQKQEILEQEVLEQDKKSEQTNTVSAIHIFANYLTGENNNLQSNLQLDLIRLMVNYNFDLSAIGTDGLSPIHNICSDRNKLTSGDQLIAIQLLIDRGYDLNAVNQAQDQMRPIHYVTSKRNHLSSKDQVKIIEKMTKSGRIDFDAPDKSGQKPIHYVTSKMNHMLSIDQIYAIMLICPKTKDMRTLDCNGIAPIHNVTSRSNNLNSRNQCDAIKYLVTSDIDLNLMDGTGNTPLHNILSKNNNMWTNHVLEILTLFCNEKNRLKIDFESVDSNGWRPIHFIISDQNNFSKGDQDKALKLLLKQKVDINAITFSGHRPIHLMAFFENNGSLKKNNQNLKKYNQIRFLKMLIHQGADIEAKIIALNKKFVSPSEGQTILQLLRSQSPSPQTQRFEYGRSELCQLAISIIKNHMVSIIRKKEENE